MRADVSSGNLGSERLEVVGLAGSLRRGSLNLALLNAARELAPPELRVTPVALGDVPLFNADLDGPDAPGAVKRLREMILAADGLLLATPEYNHGVSGVLKNAVDWLSQPRRGNVLDRKPTAIMGASTGPAGTARGQAQLRQCFVLTNTPVMLQPELLVGRAQEKFSAAGQLLDPATRQYITDFLSLFATFVREQQRGRGLAR
jgi:chromate reductase